MLVFTGGLWDGHELTVAEPTPKWIAIGGNGRYTRWKTLAPSPNDDVQPTAYYEWTHDTPLQRAKKD